MTQHLSESRGTIDDLCINTMRTLAIDAIEKENPTSLRSLRLERSMR